MANRTFTQFAYTMEKRVTNLFAQVTFGASGAPSLSKANSKGIVSVTRNAAGTFTFVFGTQASMLDTYVKLLSADVIFNSGAAAPAAPGIYIKANSINVVGTSSLQVVLNSAGTATDPASGEIGYFNFIFGDSTAI